MVYNVMMVQNANSKSNNHIMIGQVIMTSKTNDYEMLKEENEKYKIDIERLNQIFEASKEGLWDMELDGDVRFFNSTFYDQFDLDIKNSTLEDWLSLVHPDDKVKFMNNVDEQIGSNQRLYKSQYRVMNKVGEFIWIDAIGLAVFDDQNNMEIMVGSHTDITDNKKNLDRIYQLAYYDKLTGLLNHERLTEMISEMLVERQSGALILINLKQFKIINDVYGHMFGNKVLQKITEIIKDKVDPIHEVARINADQFVILVKGNMDSDDLCEISKPVAEAIQGKHMVIDTEVDIDAGIGIIRFPKDGIEVESLLRNANLSANLAKHSASNCCVVYNELDKDRILRTLKIENDLKTALSKSEMSLNYQPIVDTYSGEIIAFEALLRWNHETMGNIPPDIFIPLAEKGRTINEIGHYVLCEACKTAKEINNEMGTNFKMGVNVSVVQLFQKNFVENVIKTLEITGFEPANLVLEITESVILETNPHVISKLLELRNRGIGLSLDDFGTGYSSILNLMNLPISNIKIDRDLILKSMKDQDAEALIQAVVSYAHKLNVTVVIEGVETTEMLEKAESLKGDRVQGYYYAKPMDKINLKDLIKKWNK